MDTLSRSIQSKRRASAPRKISPPPHPMALGKSKQSHPSLRIGTPSSVRSTLPPISNLLTGIQNLRQLSLSLQNVNIKSRPRPLQKEGVTSIELTPHFHPHLQNKFISSLHLDAHRLRTINLEPVHLYAPPSYHKVTSLRGLRNADHWPN